MSRAEMATTHSPGLPRGDKARANNVSAGKPMGRTAFDNDLLKACDRAYGYIAKIAFAAVIGVVWYACVAYRAGAW